MFVQGRSLFIDILPWIHHYRPFRMFLLKWDLTKLHLITGFRKCELEWKVAKEAVNTNLNFSNWSVCREARLK